MTRNGRGILGNWNASGEDIREAMGEAIAEALREHKRAGIPAATMRDGKVVLVQPEDIVIPENGEAAERSAVSRNGH